MNVKELKEFLTNFPDEAEVGTDTNNHTAEEISYATLFLVRDKPVLYIGNGTMLAEHRHLPSAFTKVKEWSIYKGFS